jgi:hypothetical protein
MMIISPFKDYYDYLIGIYGIDEKRIYIRNKIETTHIISDIRPCDFNLFSYDIDLFRLKYIFVNGYRYLFVGEKNHPLSMSVSRWVIFDESKHIAKERYGFRYQSARIKEELAHLSEGYTSENIINFTKLVKQPVFSISISPQWHKKYPGKAEYETVVDDNVPRLVDYGIASIIPADKIYQDLDYFIGNILNDSPDLQPPVHISDKDMIEAKGFDKKISFRHRKNK